MSSVPTYDSQKDTLDHVEAQLKGKNNPDQNPSAAERRSNVAKYLVENTGSPTPTRVAGRETWAAVVAEIPDSDWLGEFYENLKANIQQGRVGRVVNLVVNKFSEYVDTGGDGGGGDGGDNGDGDSNDNADSNSGPSFGPTTLGLLGLGIYLLYG